MSNIKKNFDKAIDKIEHLNNLEIREILILADEGMTFDINDGKIRNYHIKNETKEFSL